MAKRHRKTLKEYAQEKAEREAEERRQHAQIDEEWHQKILEENGVGVTADPNEPVTVTTSELLSVLPDQSQTEIRLQGIRGLTRDNIAHLLRVLKIGGRVVISRKNVDDSNGNQ